MKVQELEVLKSYRIQREEHSLKVKNEAIIN